MESYDLFRREIKNLKHWYYGTMYSYAKTIEFINDNYREEEKKGNRTTVYYKNKEEQEYMIQQSYLTLREMYKKKYQSYIKDLSVVRIVSALEVFLVDSIIELFMINKKPFFANNKIIEFNQSEILANGSMSYIYTKVINNISSSLHRQGFDEVSKYYKNVLHVDFDNYKCTINGMVYSKKNIIYLHEIRHLIIHKLGITDSMYRHRFNKEERRIHISEDELLSVFKYIDYFGKYVNKKLEEQYLIEEQLDKNNVPFIENKIIISGGNDKIEKMVDGKFNFIESGRICVLQDVLEAINIENNNITLKVKGEEEIIHKYITILKRHCKKNNIDIKVIKLRKISKESIISKHEIKEVKKILEKHGLVKNSNKIIAKELNISNTRAEKIINIVKENNN